VFLLGVGAVLLLSADLQDEWRKLDAIERKLDQASVALAVSSQNGETTDVPEAATEVEPAKSTPRKGSGARRSRRPANR